MNTTLFVLDEVDSLAFGVRKTTTRLPVNTEKDSATGSAAGVGVGAADDLEDDEVDDEEVSTVDSLGWKI